MPYEPTLQNAKLLRKNIGTSSDKPRCLVVLVLVFSTTSWKHYLTISSQQGRRRKDQSKAKNNIKKVCHATPRKCNATLSVTADNSNWTTINSNSVESGPWLNIVRSSSMNALNDN